ncbi:MAG TPA: DMT family transporter, partial [Actinomycetes bacterium]|nr:DMT family transporter [Actinomycetes bacterium]
MTTNRRTAVAALTGAGLLWGTSVPLTKLALEWLPPGWLTVIRFGLAAAVLLAATRFRVRAVCSPAVLAWGAVGYGGSILIQNAGITRTSVSHAALLVGATPVLVAVLAAVRQARLARPVAWTGFALSLAGVGLVAAGGGDGANFAGDGLVLVSLLFSAAFTVAQARLLPGRDPVAVTAVQFVAAALATLPVAALTEGRPAIPGGVGVLAATAGLTLAGTLAPSTLFAYGQARVPAEIAGAFVNLEPLVGAAAGAVAFGDPVGLAQAAGGAAILAGIALSSLPLLRPIHPLRVRTAHPRLGHAAGQAAKHGEDGDVASGHGAGGGQLAGPGRSAGEVVQPGGGVAGRAAGDGRGPERDRAIADAPDLQAAGRVDGLERARGAGHHRGGGGAD